MFSKYLERVPMFYTTDGTLHVT